MRYRTKKTLSKRNAKDRKADKKTNMNNKKLMKEKILSYSSMLSNGVEQYIDASRNFWLLIVIGILLRDFLLISLPCCLLAMFFSVKMFQLIKYKSVNGIVNELAKDLSFKGIYNENKVDIMLDEFRNKYGQDVKEYEELTKMIDNYKAFVLKIESLLKTVNSNASKKEESIEENSSSNDITNSFGKHKNNLRIASKKDNEMEEFKLDAFKIEFDDKLALYRKKDGEIKKINRAIEFFDEQSSQKENTVILKSNDEKSDKLTVYLYKKNVDLQKNAL